MSKLITGIFKTKSKAVAAVEDLIREGFSEEDISLLMSENPRGREFAINEHTKSAEFLGNGAAIGGVIGAIVAAFISFGMLVFPASSTFAIGPWVSALCGFGAGCLVGGIIGGLIGQALPLHEADLHTDKARETSGGTLLGLYVQDEGRAFDARRILEMDGAVHCKTETVRDERYSKTDVGGNL